MKSHVLTPGNPASHCSIPLTPGASAAALGVASVPAWLINAWHFEPGALWTLRVITFLSLLALAYWFCIRPLRHRVDDVQVALYLEEHAPELKSVVLSAIDVTRVWGIDGYHG